MYDGTNEKFYLARAHKLKSEWAKALNISDQALWAKTRDAAPVEFTGKEIVISQRFLSLTDLERDGLFFALKCE